MTTAKAVQARALPARERIVRRATQLIPRKDTQPPASSSAKCSVVHSTADSSGSPRVWSTSAFPFERSEHLAIVVIAAPEGAIILARLRRDLTPLTN